MELSLRLKTIANMVNKCDCVGDIGTDHGYIPIYLIKNKICNKAVASDINKGPVEKAKINVSMENLKENIECRLGPGLATLKPKEVQGVVIAGMGGNLIRDIIEDGMKVFKYCEFAILQPVQNPEVLRKYIYEKGYEIIEEQLCIDENKFYEIIKIRYSNKITNIDNIFYEVGKQLVDEKHPLIGDFIEKKIFKYTQILNSIKDDTDLANKRKVEVENKIKKLEELQVCL